MKILNILDEKNKLLRTKSLDVIFPLEQKDIELIDDMIKYLEFSQIEEMSKKYNLRPGMGLAAIQLGVNKRYFVIVEDLGDNRFKNYIVINPKVVSHSEEMIYAEVGEGCLSVNRETSGIVKRHARITVDAFDIYGNKVTFRVREEIAIAFQHEIDHLNGILFTDKLENIPLNHTSNIRAI